jgi:hypothetical protein
VALEVPPNRSGVLVDAHGDHEEFHPIPEPLVRRDHLWLERPADLAPRRPELDENRLGSDVRRQIDGVAVQVLELHGVGYGTERESDGVLHLRL